MLQADATRCLGITGFLRASALCEATAGRCRPTARRRCTCTSPPPPRPLVHVEWFHDHARLEHLLLDGAPDPVDGAIEPDRSRPGNGLALRRSDAERHAV